MELYDVKTRISFYFRCRFVPRGAWKQELICLLSDTCLTSGALRRFPHLFQRICWILFPSPIMSSVGL